MESRLIIATLVFVVTMTVFSCAAEQFPSWIPEGAVKAATDHWNYMAGVKKGDWLIKSHGVTYNEAIESELRYPRKIVGVDYEGFAADKSVTEYFYDYSGKYSEAFGFSVYQNNTLLGSVEVYLDGDLWRMRQITGQGDSDFYLEFESFYAKYVPSDDMLIYQKVEGAYFAVRGNEVIDVLAVNSETGALECVDPLTHMIVEQNKIIEWKKSDMYKHHQSEMEKQQSN